MPIAVTAPRGELTPRGEEEIIPRLTDALLEATSSVGNKFFTSITGGTLHLSDPYDIYAGGVNRPLVLIELKLPHVALSVPETQVAFIADATEIADSLSVPGHSPADTWVNIVHVSDGCWGIGGKAYTGAGLIAAAEAGASA